MSASSRNASEIEVVLHVTDLAVPQLHGLFEHAERHTLEGREPQVKARIAVFIERNAAGDLVPVPLVGLVQCGAFLQVEKDDEDEGLAIRQLVVAVVEINKCIEPGDLDRD